MGRFLGLSALALLFIPSTYATLAVNYAPVTGVSQDGTCGNGVTCVASGFGNCCGADNTCGSTDAHCGTGCQSLFGICPLSLLEKRSLQEIERQEIERRDLEIRATTTSSACTSASTTVVTCNASNTAIIKANKAQPKVFCKNWNANKPHASSPFTGIAKPIGVSNACDCILADTTATTSSASRSITISVVQKAATTTTAASTCVPSKMALIRTNRPNTNYWCTNWLATRPHTSSPFAKIPKPIGVTNACQCILAEDAASSSASKASSATSTTKTSSSVTTTKASSTTPSTTSTKASSTATSTTSKASSTTSTKASSTSSVSTKVLATSSVSSSTTSSAASTSSACVAKKRRRRRRDVLAMRHEDHVMTIGEGLGDEVVAA